MMISVPHATGPAGRWYTRRYMDFIINDHSTKNSIQSDPSCIQSCINYVLKVEFNNNDDTQVAYVYKYNTAYNTEVFIQ